MQKDKSLLSTSVGGTYSALTSPQGFSIVGCDIDNREDYMSRVEAAASFVYGEFVISMTTSGLNHGACLSKVLVLDKEGNTKYEADSVEEACGWVQQNEW